MKRIVFLIVLLCSCGDDETDDAGITYVHPNNDFDGGVPPVVIP